MKRAIRLATTCLALILFASICVLAQEGEDAKTSAKPDRGTMPNGTYSVSDIENISLQNGNVNISIPLASLPPVAGGKLGWTLKAEYNSKLWNVGRVETDYPGDNEFHSYVVDVPQLNVFPWRIGGIYELEVRDAKDDYAYMTELPSDSVPYNDYQLRVNNDWYKVVLTMPDGAEHELRPVDYSPYPSASSSQSFLYGYYSVNPTYQSGTIRYYSFDGSYIYAEMTGQSWKVYLPDGTTIEMANGIQRIKDTNGNSVKIYSEANAANNIFTTHYQDERTEREIKYVLDKSNSAQWQGKVWYQTVGGAWQHIDINFGATVVKGKLHKATGWTELNPKCQYNQKLNDRSTTVVREIILPETEPGVTRKYTFGYNSDTTTTATTNFVNWECGGATQSYERTASIGWGSLNKIVMPSGAEINYAYSMDGVHTSFFVDSMAGEHITQKKLIHDGVEDIWNYDIEDNSSIVTNPDGSTVREDKFTHLMGYGYVFGKAGLVYRSTRPFTKVERHWIDLKFDGANTDSPGGPVSFNPVVDFEYTTLLDANGNSLKISAKAFKYDYNGNLVETKEYDWFDPSLITARDDQEVPTAIPAGATLLRVVNNSYYNDAGTPSSGNVYAKRVPDTATPRILNALKETTVGTSSTRFSYDGQDYDIAPTLGNLTKVSSFDNQGDTDEANDRWLNTATVYDSYGNKTSVTDPKGNVTLFEYDNALYGQPNRVKVNPQNGTGVQTTSAIYDPSTGLVTSQTDINGQVSTIDYTNQLLNAVDPFGRPGVASGPAVPVNGGSQRRKVVMSYEDSLPNRLGRVTVATDLKSEEDGLLKSRTTQDQLGRTTLVEQSEDGSSFTISSQTVFEQMGKVIYQSNPRRSAGASTDGWMRTTKDVSGRVTDVVSFSGSTKPTATTPCDAAHGCTGHLMISYYGRETTVTDQAGKARKSVVDALGRLIKVIEDPQGLNYETTYVYDVLGNLTRVNQGAQTRIFTYSSASRLASATNPESGTVKYQYDANGNLGLKIDPRPRPGSLSLSSCPTPYTGDRIATCYDYDGLNRLKSRKYNDGTPEVTYVYDTLTSNGKGRLTSVSSAVSTTSYAGYDALGRVTGSTQTTGGHSYNFPEYKYDLAGNLVSQTYPSGRIVTAQYDDAGRLSSISGQKTGEPVKPYAGSFSYAAHGAISEVKLGNELWEHTYYNSRMQPTEIGLGSAVANASVLKLEYSYNTPGAVDNNGNVRTQTITAPTIGAAAGFTATQTYLYDGVNRITSAEEKTGSVQNWKQGYTYSDQNGNNSQFGNRRINAADTTSNVMPQLNPMISKDTNRIEGYTYDDAGNLTTDGRGYVFTYDSENKQVSADDPQTVDFLDAEYSYDGDGKRVKKSTANGTVNTIFVYDAFGKLVAEYTDATEQSATRGASYVTADHLGSTRAVTDKDGNVLARNDYLPFGEEVMAGIGGRSGHEVDENGQPTGQEYQSGELRQKFTQKERDSETALDYFEARYYASTQGRFTSADPIFIMPERQADPQQLNLYAYVRNNPLAFVDPTGLTIDDAHLKNNEEYQTWKSAFRNTEEGKRLWDKYNGDKNFTLKVMWDQGRNGSETGAYKFSDGKLVGATLTLGSELDKGSSQRPNDQYPIQNALGKAKVDGVSLAVSSIAHEFGHLEDASQRPAVFQKLQEFDDVTKSLNKELGTQFASDPRYVEKEKGVLQAGGYNNINEMTIDMDRRAERVAIPVIQQRLGKEMPKSVSKAINGFLNPKR